MIINTSEVKHIYLANNYVDLRNSIDGLALIVSMQFDLDVMDGSIFIFTNRARNRLKILYYENNGFWLFLRSPGRWILKAESIHRGKGRLLQTPDPL